jgi:hypothetical protein
MDINHDGFISREDFELMAKRLVEYTKEITKEKSESIFTTFGKVADLMCLKPGVKIPLEEEAKITSDVLLSPTGEKPSGVHDMLFDCIDTNRLRFPPGISIATILEPYPSTSTEFTSKLSGTT